MYVMYIIILDIGGDFIFFIIIIIRFFFFYFGAPQYRYWGGALSFYWQRL